MVKFKGPVLCSWHRCTCFQLCLYTFEVLPLCPNRFQMVPAHTPIISNIFRSSACRCPTLCNHMISPFPTCWLKHRSCYSYLHLVGAPAPDHRRPSRSDPCTALHHFAPCSCTQLLIFLIRSTPKTHQPTPSHSILIRFHSNPPQVIPIRSSLDKDTFNKFHSQYPSTHSKSFHFNAFPFQPTPSHTN